MLLLLAACTTSGELVEPIVSARVDELEQILPVSTRVGVGGVSLAAAVCPLSHQDWIDLASGESDDDGARLSVSAELVNLLGLNATTLTGDGLVRYDDDTGTATVTWNDATLEEGWESTTVELEMLTAQHHFRVVVDPVGDLEHVEIEATFASCDDKALLSSAEGSWDRGDAEESFTMPPSAVEADSDDDLPYWFRGRAWPEQGVFSWDHDPEEGETVKLTSSDAELIEQNAWPATATTRTWSSDVSVPLAR